MQNNSNTFSNECALLLLGEGIPKDILDVTNTLFNTQFGQQLAPLLAKMY